MRVLALPDKFKGSASARDLAAAMVRAASAAGAEARSFPMSDGGEGLLDVFGGPNRTSTVTGPLERPVRAHWHHDATLAVIESAQACGLVLAGGRQGNDPLAATSAGVGELIASAVAAGARRLLVGLGGSACTDGGLPALSAMGEDVIAMVAGGDVDLVVCCDVTTGFVDAAAEFAPQKGATPAGIATLTDRLLDARRTLLDRYGVDLAAVPGAGAAGGLAGGLAAIGGDLRPGFEIVAERLSLADAIADADLVVTGEGRLDRTSFAGKVVGGVARLAARAGVDVVAVVGENGLAHDDRNGIEVVSLAERFGVDRAYADAVGCVGEVTEELINRRRPG